MNNESRASDPNRRLLMCINRSGKSHTIYSSLNNSDVLATLKPNEVFSWLEYYAGSHAYFTDVQRIYYKGKTGYLFDVPDNSPVFTPITKCAEYEIEIEGKKCSVFRSKAIATGVYKPSGAAGGILPAGGYIGTTTATCGLTMPYLLYADFWGKEDPSNTDAFVDMGLETRASYNDLNFELHL